MRCAICDKQYKYLRIDKKHNEHICPDCRHEIFIHNLDIKPRLDTVGDATRIPSLLNELEERIPNLFIGQECPSKQWNCGCTYESGCKALKIPVDKPASVDSYKCKEPGYVDNKSPVLEVQG